MRFRIFPNSWVNETDLKFLSFGQPFLSDTVLVCFHFLEIFHGLKQCPILPTPHSYHIPSGLIQLWWGVSGRLPNSGAVNFLQMCGWVDQPFPYHLLYLCCRCGLHTIPSFLPWDILKTTKNCFVLVLKYSVKLIRYPSYFKPDRFIKFRLFSANSETDPVLPIHFICLWARLFSGKTIRKLLSSHGGNLHLTCTMGAKISNGGF